MEKNKNKLAENMTSDRGMLVKMANAYNEKTSNTYKTSINSSENVNGSITSGDNRSFWFESAITPIAFEKLNNDIESDILIIGGGIAGLTTAYCLAKEGRNVILVEDGFIGSGETGRTTAQLTCALDDRYFELENTFGQPTSKLAAQSHTAAIEWIANTVKQHNISCYFKRVDGYLFSHASDTNENLQKEYLYKFC